jgi:hypothetical protein
VAGRNDNRSTTGSFHPAAPSPEVRTLFIAAFLPFFRTEAGGAGRPPIELKLCTRYVVSTCFNMFQHVSTCFNMFQHVSTGQLTLASACDLILQSQLYSV